MIKNFIKMASSSSHVIKFKRISENSYSPTTAYLEAAGIDLYSPYDITIKSRENITIPINVQIFLPSGCYGRIASRSSLAINNIIVLNDVMDYHHQKKGLSVILYNLGNNNYEVKSGDRIAQLICQKIYNSQDEHFSIEFMKLDSLAITPIKSSSSMGFYLFSPTAREIKKGEQLLIPTNISVNLPSGCYGRIASTTKLAINNIIIKGGVIDRDFHGDIVVVLHNLGKETYIIKREDCIGQLICEKIYYPKLKEIDDNNQNNHRGLSGFGSTGK